MSLGGSTGLVYSRMLENIEPRPLTSRRRTGRAIFVDTFEHYTALITEKWYVGAGAVALSTVRPKTGLQHMLLTTGAVIGNQAIATLYMGAFPMGQFGIAFDFEAYDVGEIAGYRQLPYIGIRFTDEDFDCYAYIEYRGEANLDWRYYNQLSAWADIPDSEYDAVEAGLLGDRPNYHHIKMTCDFDTGHYKGLWIDSKYFDLSALQMDKAARAAPGGIMMLTVDIGVTTALANAHIMRVDNVILTDQEP